MFDNSEYVGARIEKIEHLGMERDDTEIDLVKMTVEISPLTAAKAKDLSDFMRTMLYTRQDAAVTPQLHAASFNLSQPPQEIAVRMAPDQGEASFILSEAKVGIFHARRSKKSTDWRLVFTLTFQPASDHQLAQVVECRAKTRYFTFADAQPDLFSDSTKKRTKAVRAEKAQGIGSAAGAQAH